MSDLAREIRRLHDEVRAWTPPDKGNGPIGPGQEDEGREWGRSESSIRRDEAQWEMIDGRFRSMEERILALERREALMIEELDRRLMVGLKSVNDHQQHLQDAMYGEIERIHDLLRQSAMEQRRLYDDVVAREQAMPAQPHPQLAQNLRHQSDHIEIIQDEVRYLKRSLTDALELFNHRWSSAQR